MEIDYGGFWRQRQAGKQGDGQKDIYNFKYQIGTCSDESVVQVFCTWDRLPESPVGLSGSRTLKGRSRLEKEQIQGTQPEGPRYA